MEVSSFGKLFFFKELKRKAPTDAFHWEIDGVFSSVFLSLSAVLEEMFFFRPSDIFSVQSRHLIWRRSQLLV